MTLDEAVQHLLAAKRISAPRQSYAKDNPQEWQKVKAYLNGAARPSGVTTEMGLGLLAVEDVRRGSPPPPPPPPPPAGLSVDRATMLAVGGTILRQDCSDQADALTGLWGQFSNNTPSRLQFKTTGGDPGPKADGTPQGNSNCREITVADGDSWQGETAERSELGRNTCSPPYTENAPGSIDGTFAIFKEGEHKIVFFSQRYHDNFDLVADNWQVVCQLKQNQPYGANGPVDGAPAIEIDVNSGGIGLRSFQSDWIWSAPSPLKNVWIRYALEVYFSKDPTKGWMQLYVDHDGAGNFNAASKCSGKIIRQTLANLTVKGSSPLNVGDAIPSHMRTGIYHKNTFPTSTLDLDNVQVVG